MKPRLYVSRDAGALALGADEVERAIIAAARRRGLDIEIIRTGSRGLFWLEPMIEIAMVAGRIAYGPVQAADVEALLSAGLLEGGAHPLRLGRPEDLPFLKRQTRLTFARCGIVDRLSLDDYRAHGGYRGLERAIALGSAATIEEVVTSGLRGRGGAGFPTGIKWRTTAQAAAPQKYIVCNADEGDSGTFADRLLMEGDPFCLIEGMAIAAVATGAKKGFVYLRSEYPVAARIFAEALRIARRENLLGPSILGSGHAFDLELRIGAGAYICGEETSMLESLEGKRALVRAKPPIPALSGLFAKPTLINNVMSFAAVPWILTHGGQAYADYGMGRSRGTLPIQLAGNIKRGGLIEYAFGITLREVIEEFGGGTLSGRPVRAVQVGGPLGAYLPATMLDVPLDYEALAGAQAMLGHGGIVVFDDSVDMARQARFAFEFCAVESCGKCTPCRIGATRGVETIDRIIAGVQRDKNLTVVQDLCDLMTDGSLCAMGGLTPLPVQSALRHFPEDFRRAPTALAAA
ncbi:MAG TPA: NADH-ubiquinone oxidoreductase-F iron-sulfur binding region domain-containing protein [Acetobacteraceae bacterium]|nr:NADH-ubiquinone oxidoreductase-F iron-sulfur binding region domain-containing protein [Acetobacteraceae bacterium]